MNKRIGVVGIVIDDRQKVAGKVNSILSQHGDIILGRMGIPSREYNISVISLIVEGTPDELGSLTGKLGNLNGVTLKSALTSKEV
ncbi:TM1266 family iron-only hydrogenase system putative regulator [Halothermothrix orenii]|uniref:TM1266 family iron-only hydrogenase system putative regulator n=1 Tax=Halothermothrix orenii TaxID=31909 RepID=UPI0005A0C0DC